MNDHGFELLAAFEKLFPDPKPVVIYLFGQREIRADAGVDEIIIADAKERSHASHPLQVVGRYSFPDGSFDIFQGTGLDKLLRHPQLIIVSLPPKRSQLDKASRLPSRTSSMTAS